MSDNLATKYTEAMKEHPYGYALFRPALSKDLRPGNCGYIDDHGKWHPILLDIEATTNEGFTASKPLSAMYPQQHTWGPKASIGVVHKRLAFDGGADALAAGFPAEVKVALDFSTTSEFGAILHCQKSVTESGFHHREPFKAWAVANAQAILDRCRDVKNRKFCVVTSTFETSEVDIHAWSGKDKTVSMGFKAGATGVGEIGPSGQFVKMGSASEWNHDTIDEKDGKLVVFFTGVFLKYRHLVFGRTSLKEVRGDDPIVVHDPAEPEELYEVTLDVIDVDLLN